MPYHSCAPPCQQLLLLGYPPGYALAFVQKPPAGAVSRLFRRSFQGTALEICRMSLGELAPRIERLQGISGPLTRRCRPAYMAEIRPGIESSGSSGNHSMVIS